MNNFVQKGENLTLTAPSGGVVSGQGYVIGGLFVVATETVAETLPFVGVCEGVFELTKEDSATAYAEGEIVYWDNTAKQCEESAIGVFPIGTCVETAATAAATAKVKLFGYATAAVV